MIIGTFAGMAAIRCRCRRCCCCGCCAAVLVAVACIGFIATGRSDLGLQSAYTILLLDNDRFQFSYLVEYIAMILLLQCMIK